MDLFNRIKRTLSVSNGWAVLTIQAILVIFCELLAIMLVSDSISLLLIYEPVLRLGFVWKMFDLDESSKLLTTCYGFGILAVYTLLIITQKSFLMRVASIGFKLSSRVFDCIGSIRFSEYDALDKANLSSVLVPETQRAASAVISPAFNLISKIMMVLVIFIYLYSQIGSQILWFGVFFAPYVAIFMFTISVLSRNGREFTKAQADRQSTISNLYAAGKYLYFSNYFKILRKEFKSHNQKLGGLLGYNTIISQLPKYTVEMSLGVGALVGATLLSNSSREISFQGESASLLLIAMLKLLPSLQQIYRSLSQITSNYSALDNIILILEKMDHNPRKVKELELGAIDIIRGDSKSFSISDKEFILHGKRVKLDPVTVVLGDILLVEGRSGLGKTTFFENIINLRTDADLAVLSDLKDIDLEMGALKNKVSYGGQSPFFSFAELISLMETQTQLNKNKLEKLVKAWNLEQVFTRYDADSTMCLSALSGGQRRKLSLLFALLSEATIVLLDEPTNDLDDVSRRYLIKTIKDIIEPKNKTFVVITHDPLLKHIATKSTNLLEVQ